MQTLTKIGDPLDGVFTLQNRVRKNVVPHGGNWPPLGPMGAPMEAPISEGWGTLPPWGPPYQSMGEL